MSCTRVPIFNTKFPFRSILFSQMATFSVPEHHHIKHFWRSARRPSMHGQRMRIRSPLIPINSVPECPILVSETPIFTLPLVPEAPPPHFWPCRGTCLLKCGVSATPSPGSTALRHASDQVFFTKNIEVFIISECDLSGLELCWVICILIDCEIV